MIVLAVAATFAPSLANELVWDDRDILVENPHWRGLTFDNIAWMFQARVLGHYQPVTWLTFGLDYELFGDSPAGHHAVNIVLHAGAAAAFYFVLLMLLPRVDAARPAAMLGALLFAIHPMRVESVAWATARRDVLSGLLLMLTLWAYLKHVERPGRWLAYALLFYALSLLSKAWTMTLAGALLVLDVYPLRRKLDARVWMEKGAFAALGLGAAALAIYTLRREEIGIPLSAWPVENRVMQCFTSLVFYPLKTLIPHPSSPHYSLTAFEPFSPWPIAAVAVSLLSAGLLVQYRKRVPWLVAACLAYAILISPLLGARTSGPQLMAERYTYVSCLPFAILAAAGMLKGWGPVLRVATAAVIGLFAFVSAGQTFLVWQNNLSLWRHVLATVEPDSYADFNMGHAEQRAQLFVDAIASYGRVIQRDPNHPFTAHAHLNRGFVYEALGDYPAALADYTRAIELQPLSAPAHYNRAIVKRKLGDSGGAIADLDRAIELDSADARPLVERASLYEEAGRLNEAAADYDAAVRVDPSLPEAYLSRGVFRVKRADLLGAEDDFSRVIAIAPDYGPGYVNRAGVRKLRGDLDGAILDYSAALRIHPRSHPAVFGRGVMRLLRGNLADGYADLTRSIEIDPAFAEAYAWRGRARAEAGNASGAIEDFDEAMRLGFDSDELYWRRGSARLAIDDFEGARADFDLALLRDPGSADAYHRRAAYWLALDHPKPAAADLRAALRYAPDGWQYRGAVEELLQRIEG